MKYKVIYHLNGTNGQAIVRADSEEEAEKKFLLATTHPSNKKYEGPEVLRVIPQK